MYSLVNALPNPQITKIQEGQQPLTAQRAATCFQWGTDPLHSDMKGTEPPPDNILIPIESQLTALQLCR